MADKISISQSKSNLKVRLLVGTITLSFIIICLLSAIGHTIVMDIERQFEKDSFTQQWQHIVRYEQANNDMASGEFPFIHAPDLSLAFYAREPLYNRDNLDTSPFWQAMSRDEVNHFVTLDGNTYFIQTTSSPHRTEPLTLIWKAKNDTVLTAAAINKLSLAAFITFWLAVGAALLISSFVMRRFAQANKMLEKLALQDSLTKLANRNALFNLKFPAANTGALFFLDLDRFRDINDALGHEMADRTLFAFAQRLRVLAGETARVFRFRSDEFVIWQPDTAHTDIQSRAFNLLYDCREPLNVGNTSLEVSCSIGVACLPDHGHNMDMLLRNAEIAMHRAKKLRLGVQIYNDQLAYNSTMKVTLRSQLRSALHNREFVLFYQPKKDISSGRLAGAEAIVRWQHPDEGLLFPALFIDLVEQSGIVHAFTRYTVEQAVAQIKIWYEQGFSLPVSVNLSAYNLMDNAFIPFVKTCLDNAKIPPSLLEFELTESATMVDIAVTKKVLTAFKEMGIKTSIDDFGTGMSSFAYLRELDIQTVKIDQSFIRHMERNNRNTKIVEGIVSLCRNLAIDVVAEGVETEQQAELLKKLDCHIAQGYLFGRPVPADKITALMAGNTNSLHVPYFQTN